MARTAGPYGSGSNSQQPVLGFTKHGEGRVAVYGDSNCLDSSHQRSSCFGLLIKAIQYVAEVNQTYASRVVFFSFGPWHLTGPKLALLRCEDV